MIALLSIKRWQLVLAAQLRRLGGWMRREAHGSQSLPTVHQGISLEIRQALSMVRAWG
jgi:hypothetical protein